MVVYLMIIANVNVNVNVIGALMCMIVACTAVFSSDEHNNKFLSYISQMGNLGTTVIMLALSLIHI